MHYNLEKNQDEKEAARARLAQAKNELRRLGVNVKKVDELIAKAQNPVEAIYEYSGKLTCALHEYIAAKLNNI
jgi:hypothetical protein